MLRSLSAVLSLFACTAALEAADWPQWMGPNRDGVWNEPNIKTDFKSGPPKEKWRVAVGGGYAGPAVVGSKVYVADKLLKPGVVEGIDPFAPVKLKCVERVLCCEADTGRTLWKHEYDCEYHIQYPCGPRCTPLVNDGKVYTLGAMGDLCCLDAATGSLHWSKNFPRDCGSHVPTWGFSGHPIIHKNLLICLVGGDTHAVHAFDKNTGKAVWTGVESDEPGYNSPVLIEAAGATQLVIWMPKHLLSLDPRTGTRNWSVKLEPKHAMSIMSPRKEGEFLFAAGLGNVGVTLRLDPTDKAKVTEVWRAAGETDAKDGAYPVNMTPFIEQGTVYSADQPGMFRAFDLKTGTRKWETFKPIFGEEKPAGFKAPCATAFVVKNSVNGCFYLFTETGDLAIAKLSPEGYEELGRVHLLQPLCTALNGRKAVWSHPAFANQSVYARNDKHLVCLPLAK
jgi:outer membrane protein assembly factor BamB